MVTFGSIGHSQTSQSKLLEVTRCVHAIKTGISNPNYQGNCFYFLLLQQNMLSIAITHGFKFYEKNGVETVQRVTLDTVHEHWTSREIKLSMSKLKRRVMVMVKVEFVKWLGKGVGILLNWISTHQVMMRNENLSRARLKAKHATGLNWFQNLTHDTKIGKEWPNFCQCSQFVAKC